MSAPTRAVDRTTVALMWLHAALLLVVAPVWAGFNFTVAFGAVAGWIGFALFEVIGVVLVWRARNNWGRHR